MFSSHLGIQAELFKAVTDRYIILIHEWNRNNLLFVFAGVWTLWDQLDVTMVQSCEYFLFVCFLWFFSFYDIPPTAGNNPPPFENTKITFWKEFTARILTNWLPVDGLSLLCCILKKTLSLTFKPHCQETFLLDHTLHLNALLWVDKDWHY